MDGVLVTVGVIYVGYIVVRVATDLDGFLTRENAEEFLVGPVLTVPLVPLLLVAGWLFKMGAEAPAATVPT